MNKKLLTISFVAVFLMASISFVSAADSIPVKVIWDDANQANERPNEITVNLLCDGKVVDTAKLSASNSWKIIFKNLDDNETYKIQLGSNPADYSIKTTGNSESGYVITAKLMDDVLGSSADDATLEEVDETPTGEGNGSETTNDTSDNTNTTGEDNATDDGAIDNSTDDNETSDDAKTPSTTQKTPAKENKVVKQTQKTKKPTKAHMQKTGIPLAGLVLVAFAVAFVPFSRKK